MKHYVVYEPITKSLETKGKGCADGKENLVDQEKLVGLTGNKIEDR